MAKIKLTSDISLSNDAMGNILNVREVYHESYIMAVKAWHKLPADKKRIYFRRADKFNSSRSAFNLFLSEHIKKQKKLNQSMQF
ncbi:MAG TPA: hypothetical protein PKG60_05300 [Spirochaetota bacterium]|nr:hypothetical protein [Spirochaetota bacterium]HPS86916.1 hypothetical protein [Spirochaetota bacterium]